MKMQSKNKNTVNAVDYFVYRHCRLKYRNKIAINCHKEQVSYSDMANHVNFCAGKLRELGIQPEQRVALLLRDTPDFIYWFMACLQIGAVAVPLNTFAKAELIKYCLDDSRAVTLITHLDYMDKISSISNKDIPSVNHVVCCDEIKYKSANNLVDIFPVHMDDSAFWLYTSGSTGMPKAVIHRHGSMKICAEQYAKSVLNISSDDICFSTSKLFFAYGLGNSVLFPFSIGASCVLNEEQVNAEAVVKNIETFNPTIIFSVPAIYNLLLQSDLITKSLFENIKMCISAGEYLPASVFEKWSTKVNKNIYDGIGSTEAMHIFCSNTKEHCKPGTSGKAVVGYDLKIVSENGEEVAQGEVGQLVVHGHTIAKEYWHQHKKSKETFLGDDLHTGDLYRLDTDGYYIYEGRKDDAFKSSGLWVTPIEIEQTLLGHEKISEAAVIPYKNLEGFYVPNAFIVIAKTNKKDFDESEIRHYLVERLSKYKIPERINILPEMPKTATGKIARAELHEYAN